MSLFPSLPPDDGIQRDARLSECERYRYTLTRTWDATVPPLVFIGLNPSTADAMQDDPTIRRCIDFAKREGCGGLLMLNLFALRSTDPAALLTTPDPVGGDNDNTLTSLAREKVVAAWGAHPMAARRAQVVRSLVQAPLLCFGTNKDGSPKHPLYLPKTAPLVPWGQR